MLKRHFGYKALTLILGAGIAAALTGCGPQAAQPAPNTTAPTASAAASTAPSSAPSAAAQSDTAQTTPAVAETSDNTASVPPADTDEATSASTGNAEGSLPVKSALDAYTEQFPNTDLVSIEFDRNDDGDPDVYKVTGRDDTALYTLVVDANTGAERHRNTNTHAQVGHIPTFNFADVMVPEQAYRRAVIAIDAAYNLHSWKLHHEHNTLVYSFELNEVSNPDHDIEIVVNAATGDTIEIDD